MPVTTITVIITPSIAATIATQRSSVRTTTGSGTMPSGSGHSSGLERRSTNRTSRHEKEQIECHPTDPEQPDGNAGDDQRAAPSVPPRLGGLVRSDRRGDVLR